jgi:hypothetical protein
VDVLAALVGREAEPRGVEQPGQGAGGAGHQHVEGAVRGVGLGQQVGAAADRAAVADGDHEDGVGEVADDVAVDLDPEPHRRGGRGRHQGADRVAELAQVRLADPDLAELLLHAGAALAGLGARAHVHAVDDHLADLVEDEVHRPRVVAQHDPGGLLGLEGQPDPAREVVAGAERQQADDRALELLTPVQRGHDRVQAPVAARDHDPPRAGPVQDAVQLAGVGGPADLDRGALAQDGQRRPEPLLVRAAGVAVGDHEDGVHVADTIRAPGSGHPAAVSCGRKSSGALVPGLFRCAQRAAARRAPHPTLNRNR